MHYEVQRALHQLNELTPAYFLQEIFAHGSLEMRERAISILSNMDPEGESSGVLLQLLKLT